MHSKIICSNIHIFFLPYFSFLPSTTTALNSLLWHKAIERYQINVFFFFPLPKSKSSNIEVIHLASILFCFIHLYLNIFKFELRFLVHIVLTCLDCIIPGLPHSLTCLSFVGIWMTLGSEVHGRDYSRWPERWVRERRVPLRDNLVGRKSPQNGEWSKYLCILRRR